MHFSLRWLVVVVVACSVLFVSIMLFDEVSFLKIENQLNGSTDKTNRVKARFQKSAGDTSSKSRVQTRDVTPSGLRKDVPKLPSADSRGDNEQYLHDLAEVHFKANQGILEVLAKEHPPINRGFNAGVFILAGNDLYRAMRTCRGLMHALPLLWENFMRYHPLYKLHILHEADFPQSHKDAVISSYPGKVEFNQIELPTPSKEFMQQRSKFAAQQHPGYAKMCLFWFWDFLQLPSVKQYDYVMRFDTDSCIESPLTYDPFKKMHDENKVYGYRFRFHEPAFAIENLLSDTAKYVKDNNIEPKGCDVFIQPDKEEYFWCRKPGDSYEKSVESCSFPVFSTNFEVIKVEAFLQPDMAAYAKWVVESGGIIKYRWGDAPLRTLQLQMFHEGNDVFHLCEFQYQHSLWHRNTRCDEPDIERDRSNKQVFGCHL